MFCVMHKQTAPMVSDATLVQISYTCKLYFRELWLALSAVTRSDTNALSLAWAITWRKQQPMHLNGGFVENPTQSTHLHTTTLLHTIITLLMSLFFGRSGSRFLGSSITATL